MEAFHDGLGVKRSLGARVRQNDVCSWFPIVMNLEGRLVYLGQPLECKLYIVYT